MSDFRAGMVVVALTVSATMLACSSSSPTASSSSTTAPSSTTTAAAAASGASTVNVTLTDAGGFKLVPSPGTAKAGDVTFVITNTGTVEHEMLIVKTDTPFDQIPVTDAGDPPVSVATGANKIAETNSVADTGTNLKPGETRNLSAKSLAPGNYVLVCNIAGHYQLGMRAPLTVTP